jgi:hypothetical protein
MNWFKKRRYNKHCNHFEQRCIYGDEINHVGGFRAQCVKCGTYLWELPTIFIVPTPKVVLDPAYMESPNNNEL